jgi:hypothetical protein
MQSEGVFIAIVSTVVATVVAAAIIIVAVAVGAFRSPLFGLLIPNVEVVIISSGGRPCSGYDHRSSRYPHNP